MSGFLDSFRIYRDPRMAAILAMGFASGLPLALTGATLAIWMRQEGVSLTAIGLFALVGLSYNLKFLWAPVIDRAPLPGLTRWLGRRRSWTLLIQALLAVAIVALGLSDPAGHPARAALCAVAVAYLSASQDVVIDAYRVELLAPEEQGAGAAATQVGYRLGMVISGAGALYLAEFYGWSAAYAVMAGALGIGALAVLLTPEPKPRATAAPATDPALTGLAWLRGAFLEPFLDFMSRPHWLAILVFVTLYKLGDALAGVMTSPFYVDTGFTRIEIANVSKVFGVLATIAGVVAGGAAIYRLGVMRGLLVCGILQMLSNLLFAVQAMVGHSIPMLMVTIGVENFTGGMGSAAFVAYLSGLCNLNYTATQYALLTSFAALARTTLSSGGGAAADAIGWIPFFALTMLAAVPGLLMLLWLMRSPEAHPRPQTQPGIAE